MFLHTRKKLFVFVSLVIILMLGCSSEDSATAYGTWNFSGYVADGNSEDHLSNVQIEYTDADGAKQLLTTETDGSFYISSLPFGERSFRFKHLTDTLYTTKTIVLGAWSEATQIEGAVGDMSRIVSLYPLRGELSGELVMTINDQGKMVPASEVSLQIIYNDTGLSNSTPSNFTTTSDSLGAFLFSNIPVASSPNIIISAVKYENRTYTSDNVEIPLILADKNLYLGKINLSTDDDFGYDINNVTSNVLTTDGYGIKGIPVDTTIFYKIPALSMEEVTIKVTGAGAPDVLATVSGDTVFIDPVTNFKYDSLVTITIDASDTLGNRINLVFDGDKRFRTEQGIFAIGTNFWNDNGESIKKFILYDTLWVRYSEVLDSSVDAINWYPSTAKGTIYGYGTESNAIIWINQDTIFLIPDQRLSTEYGGSMGFNISVSTSDGKKSDAQDFVVDIIDNDYFITWTNTKDNLGNVRNDFGIGESVVVVSNTPILEIIGMSGIKGKVPVPSMMLDNIVLRGDTIIYTPTIYMKADTTYGMSFDITFQDGNTMYDIIPVTWRTANKIRILSTNNRQGGKYRPFKVIDDSLVVTFSKVIDTSKTADVPFTVNMVDVNHVTIQTDVVWDSTLTTVRIFNVDTFPTANFNDSTAYTENAFFSRAVNGVSFDLMSVDGEKAFSLTPVNEDIEIHTEIGLCAVNTSFISGGSLLNAISTNSAVVEDFAVDNEVTITFNRILDTAKIRLNPTKYFKLDEKSVTDTTTFSISFDDNGKTVALQPDTLLEYDAFYYVIVDDVPGLDISGAAPITLHGGTFSGRSSGNRLIKLPFKTEEE